MQGHRTISVIMSVYNGGKYLRSAIDSILSQTFGDFEFIIINDGSTDGSKGILESYSDIRIRLINNENKGQTKSLNKAISLAVGKYIARMDADDISLPIRLERQMSLMDSDHDLAMCGTWAAIIDSNDKYIREYKTPTSCREIRNKFIIHNPFIHSSMMIRKDVIDRVGSYNDSFQRSQDYELWSRIVFKYKTANIQEVLLKYRVHGDQMTGKNSFRMRSEGIFCRALSLYRYIVR